MMPPKHFILAHDLGTTGNKATLYDSEGALVGSAFPQPVFQELYISIADLGSLNGIAVNGLRVEEAPLKPGDEIVVGTYYFWLEEEA